MKERARLLQLRFGIMADLHHDIMHDGPERLQIFIDRMKEEQIDFIIQLGDFCLPIPENDVIKNIWNQFEGPKYHVLGNIIRSGLQKNICSSINKNRGGICVINVGTFVSLDRRGLHDSS